ncbi:MAG: flagellar biosynthesis protein FlhB [Planctomycetes bacterium]|nr:flagellar biosynthesis protein FlhB [Planctomycetota bacterium]
MPEQNGEKSQEATPHRRQQAREEGHVARSQDLASAALLLTGTALLLFLGQDLVEFFLDYTRSQLAGEPGLDAGVNTITSQWQQLALSLAKVLLPILLLLFVLAIVFNVLQVGLLFLPQKLVPDLSRLDPLQGLQRLFSLPSAVRLGFGMIKVIIVSAVAYAALQNQRDAILGLTALALPQIAWFLTDILLWTTIKIAAALVILALLDYGFQWWKHEQDLRMTTQEIREEMKNLQGDPQIIQRRRAVQRQLVLSRLSSTVPKADVVVTNPTELAVAIQYDAETMNAPIVVAKGAGVIAQRIRRLALEHGIPIVEKKPLAQALFKEVDLNHPIPSQLFAAVAEVLAYVYQLKGKPLPKPPQAA